MKVLHICSDFPGSKVHQNLYKSLECLGVTQEIYSYFIEKKYEGRNYFDSDVSKIHYACILKKYDRYFYYHKGRKVFHDLTGRINASKIDICHATTLFSDGGVAYRLFRSYYIPYIVTVRNSDINIHLKNAYHEWPFGKRILMNARLIVFISEALRRSFCEHPYIKTFLSQIENRIVVQPNGVDDYWLDNSVKGRIIAPNNHNLIYVGVYDDNKNVIRLVEAVLCLSEKYPDIRLTLVGGRGELKERIMSLANKNPQTLCYMGQVNDKTELKDIYLDNSIFAMPSIHETFGLVYIEAMTQGLACVYTKGQGIDQMFPEEIGIGVNPLSVPDIVKAIDKIFQNRSHFNANGVDFTQFRWINIAKVYYHFYDSIIKGVDVNC